MRIGEKKQDYSVDVNLIEIVQAIFQLKLTYIFAHELDFSIKQNRQRDDSNNA